MIYFNLYESFDIFHFFVGIDFEGVEIVVVGNGDFHDDKFDRRIIYKIKYKILWLLFNGEKRQI